MSYIVKNCPCYEFGFCTSHHIKVRGCINCTDCVIKQVIEKCKNKIRIYECYDTDYALGKVKCAESILQLFDIEEINK